MKLISLKEICFRNSSKGCSDQKRREEGRFKINIWCFKETNRKLIWCIWPWKIIYWN